MSGPYFNTTRLGGTALAEEIANAKRQDDAVLAVFNAAPGPLSPSVVWHRCWQAGKQWPLTSIRRAISNLTDDGKLVQTDRCVRGHYGKPEHLWVKAA